MATIWAFATFTKPNVLLLHHFSCVSLVVLFLNSIEYSNPMSVRGKNSTAF